MWLCENFVNGGLVDLCFIWLDVGEFFVIIGMSFWVFGICKFVGLVDLCIVWLGLKCYFENIGYGDILICFKSFIEIGKVGEWVLYEKNWVVFFFGLKLIVVIVNVVLILRRWMKS